MSRDHALTFGYRIFDLRRSGRMREAMMSTERIGNSTETVDTRDQYIPTRKSTIVRALKEIGHLPVSEQHQFDHFCRLLSAVFHYEYFEWLEKLRDDYSYFNPDVPPDDGSDDMTVATARVEFISTFEKVLKGANYTELPWEQIKNAHANRPALKVRVETPMSTYHQVRFFWRGHHTDVSPARKWFRLRKHIVESSVLDNVILLVTAKFPHEVKSRYQLKRLRETELRPGSILVKYFRQIAVTDLHMLFPKIRIVMSLYDKLTIAVPALVGGVPLLANLLPTLTVLFLVAGFYLGFSGPVAHDQLLKALAALSGVAALGGFIMQQRLKYQRLSLKYQKQISDHCYYRNVSNNGGIFDYVVGAAEEQECKEAFLAYYFLLVAKDKPDQQTLDSRIEAWLKATFGTDIDFEVDDALKKLDRLGLLKCDDTKLSVVPLRQALTLLDQRWDNFFLFANGNEENGTSTAIDFS